MNKHVRKLALSAMMAALSLVLLYLSSIVPTLRLGLAAMASVIPAIAVLEFGISTGFMVYIVTSVLALLLLPGKGTALLYVVFLGHYPMFKSLIERIRRLPVEWLLKILLFNVLLAITMIFYHALIYEFLVDPLQPVWVFLLGNLVFAAYDYAFTKLLGGYMRRFKKIK